MLVAFSRMNFRLYLVFMKIYENQKFRDLHGLTYFLSQKQHLRCLSIFGDSMTNFVVNSLKIFGSKLLDTSRKTLTFFLNFTHFSVFWFLFYIDLTLFANAWLITARTSVFNQMLCQIKRRLAIHQTNFGISETSFEFWKLCEQYLFISKIKLDFIGTFQRLYFLNISLVSVFEWTGFHERLNIINRYKSRNNEIEQNIFWEVLIIIKFRYFIYVNSWAV